MSLAFATPALNAAMSRSTCGVFASWATSVVSFAWASLRSVSGLPVETAVEPVLAPLPNSVLSIELAMSDVDELPENNRL